MAEPTKKNVIALLEAQAVNTLRRLVRREIMASVEAKMARKIRRLERKLWDAGEDYKRLRERQRIALPIETQALEAAAQVVEDHDIAGGITNFTLGQIAAAIRALKQEGR